MADFTIKRLNTRPSFTATLVDPYGAAVDLTGALSVTLKLLSPAGGLFPFAMNVLSATGGRVRYTFGANDLTATGTYQGEIEVVFGDGSVQSFPTVGFLSVVYAPDLL